MRPAQLTPENLVDDPPVLRTVHRFNEAGAINAGKRHCLYLIERKGKFRVDSSTTRNLISCM